LLDISSVVEHVLASGIDHRRLVIAGESLGTWAAMQAAVIMTRQNRPPTLVSLQNPFTCMAELGEQFVSHFPLVRSLNIGLSASALERHVLKNHFHTANLVGALSAGTIVHIATSGKDDLVHPSHSGKLAEIAAALGLRVIRDAYPQALHQNIPPIEFARRIMTLAVQSCHQAQPCHEASDATQPLSQSSSGEESQLCSLTTEQLLGAIV
jgi:acetyl esterase/lipase